MKLTCSFSLNTSVVVFYQHRCFILMEVKTSLLNTWTKKTLHIPTTELYITEKKIIFKIKSKVACIFLGFYF